jgi:membrane-associated phospholipid phosphatase
MNRIAKSWLILAMISLTCFLSCSKIDLPHDRDNLPNDVIIQWSVVALNAAGGTTYANPLIVSRIDAMMHIAMHDALNAINPRYKQYAYKTEGKKFADPFAAAASAAYTVLLASFPENKSMLDSALSASLSTIENGMLKETGINLGMESGNAILMLRAGDPVTTNPVVLIPVSTVPGVYNVVPPFDFLFAPFWQTVTPFSLLRPDQFRSAPHPALNSVRYAKDFNEIKEIGKLNSTTRTADQSAYAKWWFEFVELGWNRAARITATTHDVKLFATARMFALMNMAIADSYIAGSDSKNYYNFWRPYTAIRAAATDGNDATDPDPNWEPAEPTPPVQDYPSTHSIGANAAATMLTHFLGNHTGFSMASSTGVPANSIRSFSGFKQAADENAHSRIVAGIHFRFATDAGQKMGDEIGNWTVKNHLRPLR